MLLAIFIALATAAMSTQTNDNSDVEVSIPTPSSTPAPESKVQKYLGVIIVSSVAGFAILIIICTLICCEHEHTNSGLTGPNLV